MIRDEHLRVLHERLSWSLEVTPCAWPELNRDRLPPGLPGGLALACDALGPALSWTGLAQLEARYQLGALVGPALSWIQSEGTREERAATAAIRALNSCALISDVLVARQWLRPIEQRPYAAEFRARLRAARILRGSASTLGPQQWSAWGSRVQAALDGRPGWTDVHTGALARWTRTLGAPQAPAATPHSSDKLTGNHPRLNHPKLGEVFWLHQRAQHPQLAQIWGLSDGLLLLRLRGPGGPLIRVQPGSLQRQGPQAWSAEVAVAA